MKKYQTNIKRENIDALLAEITEKKIAERSVFDLLTEPGLAISMAHLLAKHIDRLQDVNFFLSLLKNVEQYRDVANLLIAALEMTVMHPGNESDYRFLVDFEKLTLTVKTNNRIKSKLQDYRLNTASMGEMEIVDKLIQESHPSELKEVAILNYVLQDLLGEDGARSRNELVWYRLLENDKIRHAPLIAELHGGNSGYIVPRSPD